METAIGSKTYTAYDQTVSDEDRYNSTTTYSPRVTIKIPTELGQKLYDETINNPSSFSSQEAFNEYLPGFYVTTTYGTGNMLNVSKSYLDIHYKYQTKSSTTGNDTILSAYERFGSTKEVIQLSRFKNTDMESLLQPNDDYTYIKSPAGVCTRIVIPTKEMAPILEGRILNNLPFTLHAMPQENWQFAFQAAPTLLILPEDSLKTFFENGQKDDSYTSFVASYSSTTLSYPFNNISNLIKNQIEKDKEKDLVLLAIPVKQKKSVSNSYYNTSTTLSLGHYMTPSGVRLRKDEEVRSIIVTSCKYN